MQKLESWINEVDPKGRKRFILGLVAFLVALLPAWLFKGVSPTWATFCGIGIALSGYALLAYSCHRFLVIKHEELIGGAALFVLLAILMIGVYAFYYQAFPVSGAVDADFPRRLNGVEAIYFSTVVFTTLGFGDIVPKNDLGRWMVISESIVGTTHMVFFILLFLRNIQPSRQCN